MTQPGGEFDLTVAALRELEVKGQVTRTIDPATGTTTYSLGPNASAEVRGLFGDNTLTLAELWRTTTAAAARSVRSRWEDVPVSDHEPGEQMDLTEETPQPFTFSRNPIPPAEQTRRGMLVGLTAAFVGVLLLQLGFALFLSDDTWARVGPLLSGASTLVAAGFGYAWGHYFSGKN